MELTTEDMMMRIYNTQEFKKEYDVNYKKLGLKISKGVWINVNNAFESILGLWLCSELIVPKNKKGD